MTNHETVCPNCQHDQHLPGTECEARVHHGPRRFHACLCLARPGAALPCPPQMTCQGGTLGYSDVWYLQQGHSLSSADGVISPEVLGPVAVGFPTPDDGAPAAVSVPPPAPRADNRAAVCICGHTEAQHFEDACVTEVTGCDCGDFLTGEAAREVIARWRDAATRTANHTDLPARLEAALTERFTELGNPFSAMRRQEQGPDGWPASHPLGPHHVAEVLRELLDGGPCVAGEQQNETPEADAGGCTCGAAGDCFVPLGHYADCPRAGAPE